MKASAYAISVNSLTKSYDQVVHSCRIQGIEKIAITASMTGKLMGEPDAMLRMRRRLEADGFAVFGLIYPIGHPAMAAHYRGKCTPPDPLPFYTGSGVEDDWHSATLLPEGWRYAVNEFGNPVFCCACPNEACISSNVSIMHRLARIFDEIWYDDDFRIDGDQGAGTATGSTASCTCEHCLAELSTRLGRSVAREAILSDQALHETWIEMKVDHLTALWKAACEAGRKTNPSLKMGLMVRWGGEERDGIDFARLLPEFRGDVRVRAGEGHFGPAAFSAPEGPVQAHLSLSHHISWLPPEVDVLSETTYFDGIRHEDIRKKIALAIAAGVREIAYCPCVDGWIGHQDFLESDVAEIQQWGEAFGDRNRLENPIVILRTPAAGRGSCDPVARSRDRQIIPLFNLAGMSAVVTRVPAERPAGVRVVAVTGRSVLDAPADWLAGVTVVLDGAALLEDSPLRKRLGISNVQCEGEGRVTFRSMQGWTANGLLFTRPGWVIIPYTWQDVSPSGRDAILADIRRLIAPLTGAPTLSGDFDVFLAAADHSDGQAVMLVNLTRELRRLTLQLPKGGTMLTTWEGAPVSTDVVLKPDAIRLLRIR